MKDVSLPEDLLQNSNLRKYCYCFSLIFREIQGYKILLVEANHCWQFFYKSAKFNAKAVANINSKKLKSILLNSKSYRALNNDGGL